MAWPPEKFHVDDEPTREEVMARLLMSEENALPVNNVDFYFPSNDSQLGGVGPTEGGVSVDAYFEVDWATRATQPARIET